MIEIENPESAQSRERLGRDGPDLVVTQTKLDERCETAEGVVVDRAENVVAQIKRLQGPRPDERVGMERGHEVVAEVELLQLQLTHKLHLSERVKLVVRQIQDLEIFVDVQRSLQMPDLVPVGLQILHPRVEKDGNDFELTFGAVGPKPGLVTLALARTQSRAESYQDGAEKEKVR